MASSLGSFDVFGSSSKSPRASTRSRKSVKRIVNEYPEIETVLVGDGWPIFHGGARALAALCEP